VETFADELTRKTEESSRQKEEVTSLLTQVVDLQKRVRCVSTQHHLGVKIHPFHPPLVRSGTSHVAQVCLLHIPDSFPCHVGFLPASNSDCGRMNEILVILIAT